MTLDIRELADELNRLQYLADENKDLRELVIWLSTAPRTHIRAPHERLWIDIVDEARLIEISKVVEKLPVEPDFNDLLALEPGRKIEIRRADGVKVATLTRIADGWTRTRGDGLDDVFWTDDIWGMVARDGLTLRILDA